MSIQKFIPTPRFDEYKEIFKDHFKLDRRADGVLLVQAHTAGGSIQLSVQNHRALGQLFKVIGQDPENERPSALPRGRRSAPLSPCPWTRAPSGRS